MAGLICAHLAFEIRLNDLSYDLRLTCRYTCLMERLNGQSQVSFDPLPSICEYREFGSEEDYQRTGSCSKLFKTRNAFSTKAQRRIGDDEDTEEERPLLSSYARLDSKVCDEEWKAKPPPKGRKGQKREANKVRGKKWKFKLAKGWQMQKRKVKTAWAKSHRFRQSLKSGLESSAKVLSETPILLMKTMRDAYVRVMNRLARECDQRMWYLPAARIL